jgi:hypothetical protein
MSAKYRFKTEEEFKKKGLWNDTFNTPYYWNDTGDMNKYLGQDIPEKFNDKCDSNEDFNYDTWHFESNNYVLKETSEIKEFKKGYYIVCFADSGSGFKRNHCYKQREDGNYILPELDSLSSKHNGWPRVDVNSSNWRYATPEECAEYEELCKPFNVTEISKVKKYFPNLSKHVGRYIKALKDNPYGGVTVKKGDYGLIVDESFADFPDFKKYCCASALQKDNLNVRFELMPEGFVPPDKILKEDYTGRYIRAKKREIQAIRLHPDEVVRIREKTHGDYYLDKCGESQCSGLSITYPLRIEDWELLPEGYKPTATTSKNPLLKDKKDDEYQPGDYVYLLASYGSLNAGEIYPFIEYQGSHCITVDHSNHPTRSGKYLSPFKEMCRKATPEEVKKHLSIEHFILEEKGVKGVDKTTSEPMYYTYVGDPIPKSKPLIEDVHSVDVKLSTKKKTNKLIF